MASFKPFSTVIYSMMLILLISACGNESQKTDPSIEVKVILREEPDRLHPMLSQSSTATQIESHILLPLMEYDPVDLQLKPVLVANPPEVTEFGENGFAFTFNIRDEAQWADGQPVTGHDYLFTVKAALNPYSQSNAWKGFLGQLDSVAVDIDNPKAFTVYIDESYQLALPVASNFNIYPKHHYDPKGLLDNYRLNELRQDSVPGPAKEFGEAFGKTSYSRDSVMGSGAYVLESWTAGQSILLTKQEDWWGNDLLTANPESINYLIVPDEATALTMIKSGQADIMSGLSPTVFADLRASTDSTKLSFHTPQVMQYYYLGLNTQNELLNDKKVRRALAHLLDLELMSEVLMANLAAPIASPIHTSKSYYNRTLSPVSYDPDLATEILKEAGWEDSNNDGTLDKIIDGERKEMVMDILVTQKELGRNVARVLKENAAGVGIEINIKSQEWGNIIRSIGERDFHIVAMATRQYPGIDDLYQSWHTSSIGPDGRNITAFGDEQSDAIIEELRVTEDSVKKHELFQKIQEIIYDQQPMIFLFAPTETIVHNANLDMVISSRRPGYFENTAKSR